MTENSDVDKGGSSCFAFVHRFDRHARARIGSVLKSQGLVYHQPVTFVTDGGDTVRSRPKRLHPRAEHVIDWFHIAMRFGQVLRAAAGVGRVPPMFTCANWPGTTSDARNGASGMAAGNAAS